MRTEFASAIQYHRSGRARKAEHACTKILDRTPDHAEAWHLLGLIAAERGQNVLAAQLIGKAIELGGPVALWCVHLGAVLEHDRNFPGALACYRQAIASSPNDPAIAFRLGCLLVRCGQYDEAIDQYRRVVAIRPDSGEAWFNLGVASSMASRVPDAIAAYRKAIALNSHAAESHNNLAILFHASGHCGEAAMAYEAALATRPDYVDARYNLGLLRQQQDRLTDAAAAYRQVLRTAPRHAEAHNNLGNTLLALNEPAQAREAYWRALAIDQAHPEARWNLGFVDLLMGNFAEGWRNYEWRFQQSRQSQRYQDRPQWNGESLNGRRLLLWTEQGLGDTIQMIRFAGAAADAGGRVTLECPKVLEQLLRTARGIEDTVIRGEQPPAFDVQLPLMSLPGTLGVDLDSLPGPVPYLSAPPERVAFWRSWLESYAPPRIGLAWSGNPNHANDRNRSMAPSLLRPLVEGGGTFFTLQPDATAFEGIVSLGEMLPDFTETAAAISAMDLVISVDTSVAHLAGALGQPVWTLLPHAPDWRWMMDRADSPWYPTMRLFRQETRGDWAGVIKLLREELSA